MKLGFSRTTRDPAFRYHQDIHTGDQENTFLSLKGTSRGFEENYIDCVVIEYVSIQYNDEFRSDYQMFIKGMIDSLNRELRH